MATITGKSVVITGGSRWEALICLQEFLQEFLHPMQHPAVRQLVACAAPWHLAVQVIQSRRAHNADLPLSFRGIGHGLVKKFLERSNKVIATARVPQDAQQLQQLAASNSNLTVAALDISNPQSIMDFAAEVKKHTSHVDVSGSKLAGGVGATSRCIKGEDARPWLQWVTTN